jgi:hypothetical protein
MSQGYYYNLYFHFFSFIYNIINCIYMMYFFFKETNCLFKARMCEGLISSHDGICFRVMCIISTDSLMASKD